MKKTLFAILVLAGVTYGNNPNPYISVDAINNTYGSILGGDDTGDDALNTAIVASQQLTSSMSYAELSGELKTDNEWYITQGFNNGVYGNNYAANEKAITFIAGGPAGTKPTVAAMAFSVSADTLQSYTGALTLAFDINLANGNNNKNHQITFYLLNSQYTASSITYNTKEGSNISPAETAAPATVTLTFTANQLADMQSQGDQTFIFMAACNDVTGSNRGIAMSNFRFVPEPATATLSLLALAGLAARRRRR